MRIRGESSCSKFARTNRIRTPTVSTMPMTPQRIQAGKNDPRMLKEGAREQPISNTLAPIHNAAAAIRKRQPGDDGNFVFMSGDLSKKQIAGLIGQSGQAG